MNVGISLSIKKAFLAENNRRKTNSAATKSSGLVIKQEKQFKNTTSININEEDIIN